MRVKFTMAILLLMTALCVSLTWSAFDIGSGKFRVEDSGFIVLTDTGLAWEEVRIVQELFRVGGVAPVEETGFRGVNNNGLNFRNNI